MARRGPKAWRAADIVENALALGASIPRMILHRLIGAIVRRRRRS